MSGDLWPPPSVPDDADLQVYSEQEFGASVGPDSTVLLLAKAWGRVMTTVGVSVMAALVESKPLERMIMDGNLETVSFGVVGEVDNSAFAELCPALWIQLKQFQTFTPLTLPPCPWDWEREVVESGFALMVRNPDPTDPRVPYVKVPALSPADGRRIEPTGRTRVADDDRCPCGSGVRFRLCCGG